MTKDSSDKQVFDKPKAKDEPVNTEEKIVFIPKVPPAHVYTGVNAILGELGKIGIAKGRKNQQQNYSFRGIDDVYAALNPLLAEHQIIITPNVMERNVTERETQKGGVIFYTNLKIRYSFISVVDGTAFTCDVYGEAMDSADKATNKAMSAAYKTLCLQIFCIPTEAASPDADNEHHDIKATPTPTTVVQRPAPTPPTPEPSAQRVMIDELLGKIKIASDQHTLAYLFDNSKELLMQIPPPVVTIVMNAVTAREAELKGASND